MGSAKSAGFCQNLKSPGTERQSLMVHFKIPNKKLAVFNKLTKTTIFVRWAFGQNFDDPIMRQEALEYMCREVSQISVLK